MQAQKTKNCNKHHYFKVKSFILYFLDNDPLDGLTVAWSPGVQWFDGSNLGQTKDNNSDICCFSPEYALRNKSKDWSAGSPNNVTWSK